ncbi:MULTISPECIES: glycoside hydrolase family protein [unclassified Microcoleus]|uniref:glycoside hydrolase family protein n=1 Tax=unclassified Microcoleus TaxID=2642155 RepID=UPI001D33DED9|nr:MULTISPECIES: glycoside hydrolase family protein [unclassified Microcoleus]MCC3501410.1 glycoside hydrolase family protein [Microcoleus sp. PH2017_19_SFW_U_A]MCC3473789.1 glycoside hydrolase family protein [Microcoleus sp. PH2017_13_LAR_U_A]MCC3486226.1 glycoside hydrolase family protein [Microcoleus sp. PH2017_14_LAR_D_A]MCC3496783.1 glycoside hydrolase family protein [Microcoleus sp. PH2017_15_JOR_U_A]MCC3520801.1 glycoside hydrolase family protein [Microcoleus sp. PH2017_20_SFW_D_A]
MSRELKIFKDGRVYEMENDQPIKVIETEGIVRSLIELLQFTPAETFTIAPTDAVPPDVPEPKGPIRKINQEGLKLVQSFEGLYLEAYRDPVGVWTIGWGATEGVYPGMKITVAEAEKMLQDELEKFEAAVADAVKVQINDDQFSALVCFSYNLGARSLSDSMLLKLLNEGKFQEAADQFPRWDKAGGQSLLGLSRRRRAERALFLSQPWEEFLHWEPERVLRLAEIGQPLVQGDDVRQAQKALIEAGFDVGFEGADGIFGMGTDRAVREFQQHKGLTVDGIVGAETLRVLGI